MQRSLAQICYTGVSQHEDIMKHQQKVTLQQLREGYKITAKIVSTYGDKYLPIFKRLHDEMEKRMAEETLKNIALQVAQTMD